MGQAIGSGRDVRMRRTPAMASMRFSATRSAATSGVTPSASARSKTVASVASMPSMRAQARARS